MTRGLVGALCVCLGCGDPPAPAPSAASGPDPASSAQAPLAPTADATAAASAASADDETSTRPLELLKLVLTTEIKGRDPGAPISSAKPGQKVYAHVTVRNRSGGPRKVTVAFKVGGEKRTTVDLFVEESWAWRTWAYNTVLPRDAGKKIEIEVTDDAGHPLFEGSLPVAR